ncbi:hypothetical protein DL93DRAFT_2096746 [Clavulina sp. PMI_390]|nr:hypothetical protein DL93DRAFT_2096746 [Clavulina sp. PMI_390]
MSLITDVEHSDDPYAPRVVSFQDGYDENPYIRAAGLADSDRWPELDRPSSPVPTPHEEPATGGGRVGELPGKWPGATGLRYTQTIMGNRAGGAGMRVTGRRTSRGSPFVKNVPIAEPPNDEDDEPQQNNVDPAHNPIESGAPASPGPIRTETALMPAMAAAAASDLDLTRRRSSGGSTVVAAPSTTAPNATIGEDDHTPTPPLPPLPTNAAEPANDLPPLPLNFRPPKFARGAEMEARRRRRIQMRMPQKVVSIVEEKPQEAPRPVLLLDDSSSSEESVNPTVEGSMTESEADAGEMPSDFEDVSFLRPDYNQRNTSNGSVGASLLSANLGMSVSQASVNSSLPLSERTRARLSPVAEASKPGAPGVANGLQPSQTHTHHPRRPSRTHGKGGSGDLSAVTGATSAGMARTSSKDHPAPDGAARPAIDPHQAQQRKTSASRTKPGGSGGTAVLNPKPSVPAFRKKPLPTRTQSSALTARLMAKSSSTVNPFHYLYAGITGREDSHFEVRVYFPHSVTYKTSPRTIRVRKDVSVEEVIGHALWVYWEDKAEPPLDDPIPPGVEKKVRLSSAGWCLRIVEEDTDGEVDEDYPVIGRGGPIQSWLKHDLAVCEASDAQIKSNLDLDSIIVRRASRLMKAQDGGEVRGTEPSGAATDAPPPKRRPEGTGYSDDEVLPPPVVHHTGTGEKVLLRVRWETYADSAHLWTTLAVTTDIYLADVLEMACRKRRLENTSKDWALLLDDKSILLPLDRTVVSLFRDEKDLAKKPQRSLIIIKRSLLDSLEPGQARKPGRSSDPNASIFDDRAKVHATAGVQNGPEVVTYKKFTVKRKVPMVFGSHERILAMDGDYIYIIPSASKALLENPKTSSYHIKTVRECPLPKKDSSTVRLVIVRDDLTKKRYDFEADSRESALEIVSIIKGMQKAYEGPQRSKSTRRPRSSAGGTGGAVGGGRDQLQTFDGPS